MPAQKKTNAVRIMERLKIPFELLEYSVESGETSALDASAKTGVPKEQIFKTLIVRGDKTGVLAVCVPGGRKLDLKALAEASGNKKIEMVGVNEITPLTGYIKGGCSPVGTKKSYPVYIDSTALSFDRILVNAGLQGLVFKLSPSDLIKATGAAAAGIAH